MYLLAEPAAAPSSTLVGLDGSNFGRPSQASQSFAEPVALLALLSLL